MIAAIATTHPTTRVPCITCHGPSSLAGHNALGPAVTSLGSPTFPTHFLSTLRAFAGIDMVSAFTWHTAGGPRFIFAGAMADEHKAFAHQASQHYAASFWRHDPAVRRLVAGSAAAGPARVHQQSWREIPASVYRVACYERPGV